MIFSKRSRAANSVVRSPIWSKFELIRAFIVGLVTCKNKEDPIQKEGTGVLTRLNVDFSESQGQLTQQSVVESGLYSNSYKLVMFILVFLQE